MMAEPKARSQGSNAGGGGGALAFTAISAANVEPAVIASTAAANTSFFMTIPIALKGQSGLIAQGPVKTDCNQLCNQSETWNPRSEAKKTSICRLFRRYRLPAAGCWTVLHSHNNFAGIFGRRGGMRIRKETSR